MLKIKPKLKEASRKILERSFNMLEGTGIGKIPGVFRVFAYLSSITDKRYIKVDGQKLRTLLYHKPKHLLYYANDYEPHVSSIFCSMLKEGMTVVDVGSSLGYYVLLAAKRVGDDGQVISFEPDPLRFERLLENIQINGWNNVKAFQLAVSDTNKNIKFRRIKQNGFEEVIDVNAVSLDSFLQTADIDMVKIDVEGAELEVLRGMKWILTNGNVKIICEVHPSQLSSLGYGSEEIVDLLRQYNYNIYLISEKGLIPTTSLVDVGTQRHYLFTKEEI